MKGTGGGGLPGVGWSGGGELSSHIWGPKGRSAELNPATVTTPPPPPPPEGGGTIEVVGWVEGRGAVGNGDGVVDHGVCEVRHQKKEKRRSRDERSNIVIITELAKKMVKE
eukprot:754731-Hanusia_phi.AAC.4